jgi:TP901 family phage tail tape measure protein
VAEAVELATAYLALVPSMKDSQGQISKQLMPGAESAGAEAGKAAGSKFSGGFGKAAAVGGVAAAGAVAAGFHGLYEVGAVFDDVSDTIRVGTGKSGAALEGLVKSAESVGRSVPADFAVVGQTVADLNQRLGLSGPTLEKVASQYLEAGRMLGTDIDVGATTAAFSAFKIEGEAVSGAMDTLFQVSQSTGVGMNELAAAVQKNAPAMQTLGFSFSETAALAGSLDKAGLNSTAMMSSMSKGMVTLAKKGEEPASAFKRVTGEIQGFVDKGDKAAAIDLAAKVFGTKGASQFIGALESGSIAMDDLVGGAALSGDTILGVGKETQDFAEKWQLVQNNATAALAPLGSAVFSWLGETLTAMMPTLTGIGEWLGENTWAFGVLAGIIGGVLVAAFVAWAVSAWAVAVAMLANPVTWIILAIIALIAIIILLVMNWDAVVAWLSDIWGSICEWVVSVFEGMGSGLSDIWNGISAWFTSVFTAFGAWLGSIWQGISDFAIGIWNGLVSFIGGIPGAIMAGLAFLANLASMVGAWFAGMAQAAIAKGMEMVNWVASIPGQIIGFLSGLGSMLWNAGSEIMAGLLDGIKAGFQGIADFVGGIGQWIADHKGPKAYDLALLVPAGGWIMGGFVDSLRSHIPELKSLMGDVTDTISVGAPRSLAVSAAVSGQASGGMPAGTGGTVNNITVNNPVPEPAGRSISSSLAKVAYLGLDGGE